MKISVIVPAYRAGLCIGEALRSILGQQLPNEAVLRIIVILDGPDAHAKQVVNRIAPEATLIENVTNLGPSAARNAGLAVADGDFIAFLDADDVWPAGKLARELELIALPGPGGECLQAVFGLNQKFTSEGTVCRSTPTWTFLLGCGLYRRELVEKIGGFNEEMFFAEDTDWFFRIWETTNHWYLRFEVALYYRQHHLSHTANCDRLKPYLAAVKKTLDRRRPPSGKVRPLPPLLQKVRVKYPGRPESILLSCLRAEWARPGACASHAIVRIQPTDACRVPAAVVLHRPQKSPGRAVSITTQTTLNILSPAYLLSATSADLFVFEAAEFYYHADRLPLQVAWHVLFPQHEASFTLWREPDGRGAWKTRPAPQWGTLAVRRDLLAKLPENALPLQAMLFRWFVELKKNGGEPCLVPWELAARRTRVAP